MGGNPKGAPSEGFEHMHIWDEENYPMVEATIEMFSAAYPHRTPRNPKTANRLKPLGNFPLAPSFITTKMGLRLMWAVAFLARSRPPIPSVPWPYAGRQKSSSIDYPHHAGIPRRPALACPVRDPPRHIVVRLANPAGIIATFAS